MKKFKIAAVALALGFTLGCAAACGGDNLNTAVPEDTDVTLTVEKENGNAKVFGIGTELDPHFFSQNVGLKDEVAGWECKEEDWDLFEERMEEMNLKRIRVMLLPHWFVTTEANTLDGIYDWNSDCMQSLYRVLDSAKKFSMKVNITMWGCDTFMQEPGTGWVGIPKVEYEEMFVNCFADCIKYLIEEKGYDCIKEVTLYNEPNSGYTGFSGNDEYCDLCKKMHSAFQEKQIREKVLFNLSDDARDYVWLGKTLENLQGIIDVSNSHSYTYGDTYDAETDSTLRDMSNEDICYNLNKYNLNNFKEFSQGYGVPHMWGEFGTKNGVGSHQTLDTYTPDRGIDISRIVLNFFNMGSVGASYWVLYSQYYNRSDFANHYIMDMGLWGFADEGYECRPVYYAYSMITRFIEEGDTIFPLTSADGKIVGTAFRNGEKWSYCVVNNGDEDKKVSFVNMDGAPATLNRYVYDEKNVPTDNKVIGSSGEVSADGRVLSDTVKARSFAIYTNK